MRSIGQAVGRNKVSHLESPPLAAHWLLCFTLNDNRNEGMKSQISNSAFVLLLLFCPAAATTPPVNVVVNGDFEADQTWQFAANNGAKASGEYDKAESHGGKRSYRLNNQSAFAPHVYGRVSQIVRG